MKTPCSLFSTNKSQRQIKKSFDENPECKIIYEKSLCQNIFTFAYPDLKEPIFFVC